jgi:hypothetical protein
MTRPISTARDIGEAVEVREAHTPGIRDATPTPEALKRKFSWSLPAIPTTASIFDGKSSNPIAEMVKRRVANVIMFLSIMFYFPFLQRC